MAELKTTTRYLDATLLEHSLLRNARLRTPYGMQEGVPAYTTETEGMMLHDLTLALADMACRTGISWNTDPTPIFRDGDTEVSIVLERDQPNDHYSHLDAQQRIYGHTAVLSKCGIRIQGRARKLRINYRTTEQIRSAADSIFLGSGADVADSVFAAIRGMEDAYDGVPATLFDDLDGGESPTDDSRSLMSGPAPETRRFASQTDEMDAVREWIYGLCGPAENTGEDDSDDRLVDSRNVCVVARSRYYADQWYKVLDDGLPYGVYRLGRDAEDRQRPGIRIATMHRVKGLEFDYVAVVDVNDGVCPQKSALQAAGTDSAALNETYKEKRSLIYVAMTRAKKGVLLTGVSAHPDAV